MSFPSFYHGLAILAISYPCLITSSVRYLGDILFLLGFIIIALRFKELEKKLKVPTKTIKRKEKSK